MLKLLERDQGRRFAPLLVACQGIVWSHFYGLCFLPGFAGKLHRGRLRFPLRSKRSLVEAAGIEPASERIPTRTSTCLSRILNLAFLPSSRQDDATLVPVLSRLFAPERNEETNPLDVALATPRVRETKTRSLCC